MKTQVFKSFRTFSSLLREIRTWSFHLVCAYVKARTEENIYRNPDFLEQWTFPKIPLPQTKPTPDSTEPEKFYNFICSSKVQYSIVISVSELLKMLIYERFYLRSFQT